MSEINIIDVLISFSYFFFFFFVNMKTKQNFCGLNQSGIFLSDLKIYYVTIYIIDIYQINYIFL